MRDDRGIRLLSQRGVPAVSTEDLLRGEPPVIGMLEREGELAELDRALAAAAAGDGRLLVIEGPPGIGKTALLTHLGRRARDREATVLTAWGGELERAFGFGIVRQLLGAPLAAADGVARDRLLAGAARLAEPVFADAAVPADGGEVAYASLHGLYWLVANLAEVGPLVLAVDDVHWADEPSLRFLLHLALRLAGMPILVVLAVRPGTGAEQTVLRSLLLEARLPILAPRPLGGASVAQLVGQQLGAEAADTLSAACRDATGGNPFLLTELLGELRRDARPPPKIDPDAVRRLGPDRIASAVLLRIGQLDQEAPALARSVAVLGDQARVTACAQLAGLEPGRARELIDALVELAVLDAGEPLRFVHPIVRTAIYEDLAAGRRGTLHAKAAGVLAEHRADPETIAVHLLNAHPAGDPAAVAVLRTAAGRAMSSGAPDTAAALLRRALEEPPAEVDRAALLFELGDAEHQLGSLAARRYLREAGDLARDPVLRARAFIGLAVDTQAEPALQRAQLPLYEHAARAVGEHERELALELQAARLGALLFNPDVEPRFEDEVERFRALPGASAAECVLLSFATRTASASGIGVLEAADVAARIAAHPAWAGHRVTIWRINTILALVAAERYDVAERLLARSLQHAQRIGSPRRSVAALWLRALTRQRSGDLRGADADLEAAVEVYPITTSARVATIGHVRIDVLTDQGRHAEARALLADHGLDAELPRVLAALPVVLARGRLYAASGELEAARTDLEDALARLAACRWLFHGQHEARVALVPVLHALGATDRARALAEETAELAARAQIPRAIGGALRVSGLIRGGKEGLALLERAVETLTRSPSVLWRAEALVDLGAAQRRDGQRTTARDTLRSGLDLADRCGAALLAGRAADELRAAGARPRRSARSGIEALTAGERRVAELAASGKTNKQIAQSLFVTLRTVEMHLSNSYRKLAIASREDLVTVLSG
jgi:DNA-binding CsgD family transcriptional regulator